MFRCLRYLHAAFAPPRLAFGGGNPTPPPPPVMDSKALIPPMLQSPQGADAAAAVRQRAAAGRGYGGTIVTGPQGLTTPAVTQPNALKPVLGG